MVEHGFNPTKEMQSFVETWDRQLDIGMAPVTMDLFQDHLKRIIAKAYNTGRADENLAWWEKAN